jgi:hypothetical protein
MVQVLVVIVLELSHQPHHQLHHQPHQPHQPHHPHHHQPHQPVLLALVVTEYVHKSINHQSSSTNIEAFIVLLLFVLDFNLIANVSHFSNI